ncbi:hypothetical protein LCGC14_2875000 [marine sediment metagenome]|uniref:Uncharacterized protein n=1 Tax=marine sediment metagenome TaxID=412755 RepID=A0A0F8Y1Y3_9ZZZZ
MSESLYMMEIEGILQDVSFDLRVALTPPEFKTYVAHRLTSIISDTGVSI